MISSSGPRQRRERGLNLLLRRGVQRACRFVEDQNARVLEKRSSNRQPLTLASGEAIPAFAHQGLVAVRQRGNHVVNVRAPCRRLNLGLRCRRPAVSEILENRGVEQERFLGHDGDMRAQGGRLMCRVSIRPPAPRRSSGHAAWPPASQRGLARARRPHERHGGAGRNRQVDLGERVDLSGTSP